MIKAKLGIATVLIAFTACKTPASSDSAVKDDLQPTGVPDSPGDAQPAGPAVGAPFASGDAEGIHWDSRFNFGDACKTLQPIGVNCQASEATAAAELSGTEAQLKSWVENPEIKSVRLAYFSFSNKPVAKILCDGAIARPDLKINVFLHRENIYDGTALATGQKDPYYKSAGPVRAGETRFAQTGLAKQLATCSPANLIVTPRGTVFGSGYLHHAKIFLASEQAEPHPLHKLPADQQAVAAEQPALWTSSSANMSSFGTSLHLENWLLFSAKTSNRLAQENFCFFEALETMKIGPNIDERADFAKKYAACIKLIQAPVIANMRFYPVPHNNTTGFPKVYPDIKALIDGARTEIRIAIHRLTTSAMTAPLVKAKQRGVDVQVIVDDDTFRKSKCDTNLIDQTEADVNSMKTLLAAGIPVTVLETTPGQLAHNKFMVVDAGVPGKEALLQGAGNFTATSLNSGGPGNIENFYIFRVPELIDTYKKAWEKYRTKSTELDKHPVANRPDC